MPQPAGLSPACRLQQAPWAADWHSGFCWRAGDCPLSWGTAHSAEGRTGPRAGGWPGPGKPQEQLALETLGNFLFSRQEGLAWGWEVVATGLGIRAPPSPPPCSLIMPALRLLGLLAGLLATSAAGAAPLVDIVGGRRAQPQQFPFLASIQNQGKHFCMGSLLHPRFILTAASCFRSRNSGIATVVLGAYDLRRRERTRQTFSIRGVSENGYDPQQNLNDMLLLQWRN
nr:azurocidin isoform X2 [Camelus dromedarius]